MSNPRHGLRDLKGQKFGFLLVLHKVRTAEGKKQNWRCRCDCGTLLTVRHDYLIHTNTPKTHCGCKNKGPSVLYHSEYHIWNSMLQRCHSEGHPSYKEYGARGIKVCDEWRKDFMNFYRDMGPRPSKDHSLDRIDPDGNYELKKADGTLQLRWATGKQQARNKRKSIYLVHPVSGKVVPAAEIAEYWKVSYQVMRYRMMKAGLWIPQPKPKEQA